MIALAGIAALAFRRALSPAGRFALLAAAACLGALAWRPLPNLSGGTAAGGADATLDAVVEAGLGREAVWLAAFALLTPWFAVLAARTAARARRGEGDWLGGARPPRAAIAAANSAGLVLALGLALGTLGLVALAAETARGAAAPELCWVADTGAPAVTLLDSGARREFTLAKPEGATHGIARFVVALPGRGAPQARVRGELRLEDAPETARGEALVTGNTSLVLEASPRGGRARFAFERVGEGAVVVLEGPRIAWYRRADSRLSGAFALFLQAWLAIAATAALAQAAAVFVSAPSALLAAGTLLAIPWLDDGASRLLPGAELRRALAECADGHAVRAPGLAAWLGLIAAVAAASLSFALARAPWRRQP